MPRACTVCTHAERDADALGELADRFRDAASPGRSRRHGPGSDHEYPREGGRAGTVQAPPHRRVEACSRPRPASGAALPRPLHPRGIP